MMVWHEGYMPTPALSFQQGAEMILKKFPGPHTHLKCARCHYYRIFLYIQFPHTKSSFAAMVIHSFLSNNYNPSVAHL